VPVIGSHFIRDIPPSDNVCAIYFAPEDSVVSIFRSVSKLIDVTGYKRLLGWPPKRSNPQSLAAEICGYFIVGS
jgi:hypothetical protein